MPSIACISISINNSIITLQSYLVVGPYTLLCSLTQTGRVDIFKLILYFITARSNVLLIPSCIAAVDKICEVSAGDCDSKETSSNAQSVAKLGTYLIPIGS